MSAHILKSHIHSAGKDGGKPGKRAWKKQTNRSTLFWVKADIWVVVLFLKVQLLVALQTVPPAVLTRIHCVTELLDSRFMYEFGGAFPRSPVQVQKAVFPCVLAENAKKQLCCECSHRQSSEWCWSCLRPVSTAAHAAFQDLLSCGQRPRSQPPETLTTTRRPVTRHSLGIQPITAPALPSRQRHPQIQSREGSDRLAGEKSVSQWHAACITRPPMWTRGEATHG